MNKKRVIGLVLAGALVSTTMSGCVKPYQEPIFEEIKTNETAFLVPLVGDATEQSVFSSIELLQDSMVSSKRIEIPTEWVQKGRFNSDGDYLPTMKLIKVNRTPITREWTESSGDGTSNQNQGITAESIESIAFMARMSSTASIEESNTARFLYYYNAKTLSEVMDTEIRPMIEGIFNEECGKRTLNQILQEKEEIMDIIEDKVINSFEEKGNKVV